MSSDSASCRTALQKPVSVAFGPEMTGWGSWDWVGADVARALNSVVDVRVFHPWEIPHAEIVIVVKHLPPVEWAECVARQARLIYAPVDGYGSASEIDQDAGWLRKCSRIVIHCEELRKYFSPYAPVEFMDHHVKFIAPMGEEHKSEGGLLWIGVRTNLSPLVAWVNEHDLSGPLDVLTNFEVPEHPPTPTQIGFRTKTEVRIHNWSPERHLALTAAARAVIDIKGEDFRSRHKPPAKAIDFIASGVPLAMNEGSSPVEHLARMGFDVACPLDPERWLSRDYWKETRRFGLALRELLSLERVVRRWRRIIQGVSGDTSSVSDRGSDDRAVVRR
jgi:hypothetical protein